MESTFILFISYHSWFRYGRRPHYSELKNFGKLFVVEEPLKIISKDFLSNPYKAISNFLKFSKGVRNDDKYNIKIIRPILLFSAKLKNSNSLLRRVDHLLLSLQMKKFRSKYSNYFCMLTNRFQEWVINGNKNSFYVLDIDDEWSMIGYDEFKRMEIEADMRRLVSKVDLATTVTIELKKKYNLDNKVFFLPNAVDTNHYVPSFDITTNRLKEKNVKELNLEVSFLKYEQNDPRIYLTNLEKMKQFKKPIIGSISGLAGNWSDFKFISKVEELLPSYITMISSGNVHAPTNSLLIDEYENYLKKQRMIYLGYLDYSVLPDFLGRLDVGIVMHRMDPFNKHSAPNKIWAYLAMGLPVVSTDFLNDYDKEIYEGLVNFANTPEEYVEYIVSEYKSNNLEKKKKRRELALRYSTTKRAEKLYNMLIGKANKLSS